MQSADDLISQGKWQEACSALEQELTRQPDNPQIHHEFGLTLLKQERYADAIFHFQEACRLKPGFAAGFLHCGLALLRSGKPDAALQTFHQAQALQAQTPSVAYLSAVACYQLKDYEQAASLFKEAVSLDPNLHEALHGLGLALADMGNTAEALDCFARAWHAGRQASVAKDWAAVLSQLGMHHEAGQRYHDAIQAAAGSMGARDRAQLYNDWAVNLFHRNELEAAAEKLRESLSIDPNLFEAKLNLGLVEASLTEHDHSIEVLDNCLKTDPENAEAHLYRGIAYLLQEQAKEARVEFERSRACGLPDSQFNLWPGYAQIALGNNNAALQYFNQYLADHPEDYHALDACGCLLLLSGDALTAASRFEDALRINREFALALWHLAGAHEMLGNLEQAKKEYHDAAMLDSRCLLAEKDVFEQLISAGDYTSAAKLITRLLDAAPQDLGLQLMYVRILLSQNELDTCEQLLKLMLETYPGSYEAAALLGHVYLAQSRLAEADETFQTACRLGDAEAPTYLAWGHALRQLGINELAVEKYRQAAQIDPFNGDVYDAWGSTLKALGRFAEASEVYKQASAYIY